MVIQVNNKISVEHDLDNYKLITKNKTEYYSTPISLFKRIYELTKDKTILSYINVIKLENQQLDNLINFSKQLNEIKQNYFKLC